jgi:coenzyme PQQ synthesis protein D (PqqD)
VIVPDSVMIRDVAGESVILNLDTEAYFGLDEIGTRMWHVLTTSKSIQAAITTLLDEYEVNAATLERDVRYLLTELAGEGLINFDSG